MTDVNQKQVGGSHYNQVQVQHWDLMLQNRVPYLEAQITKYVTRWKKKHGAQDVEKSTHYLEKLQDALNTRRSPISDGNPNLSLGTPRSPGEEL
jgi:hypothetical protein